MGDVVTITGRTTDVQGRFMVSARTNHFITDSRGGPGEAVQAGELMLSALASCALGNIETHARELGVAMTGGHAEISFERDENDGTRYEWIRLTLRVDGVDRAQAERLVGMFTDSCPIYNTLRRGGNVEVVTIAGPARPEAG